tara:strand:+ start:252 stop:932 length:681 start_codon:yes stop_codon:yes gene_type:complete
MSRTFSGFTEETLSFQNFLREENWARDAWDEISRETWKNNVKPELNSLLSDCASTLSERTEFAFQSDIARGYNQGGPTKFFWGAVVPQNGHRHTDIQLFVALRSGYVRAGLFLENSDKAKAAWNFAINSIENNEQEATNAIEQASIRDIKPCIPMGPKSKGTPIPTKIDSKTNRWSKTFENHKQMDILRAWKVENPILQTPEFSEEIVSVFMRLMPLYRIISNHDS